MKRSFFRRVLLALVFVSAMVAAFQAGCGNSDDGSQFNPGNVDNDSGFSSSSSGSFGSSGNMDGSGSASDADPDALGALIVTPATVTITVNITNGTVNSPPQQFNATYNGQQVPATWLFDRGELGTVDGTGVFTANGKNVGEGTLTARYGAREGTAKIKVVVNQQQNGAPNYSGGAPDAGADGGGGFGGLGGVGGDPLGGAVSAGDVTKLKGAATAPANAQELGFLYPYDKTVWPKGLLAPLLMWQSTYNDPSAVYVKLSQGNYTFEGTYSLTALTAGEARKRVRIQDDVWKTATQGNQGDDLNLEVRILTAAGNVIGPITRTWKVAAGVLKGTVYYNSYDSLITTGGGAATGGVIAIKPRSPDPQLAVPTQAGKCHVCHVVSSDGSTLFAQDSVTNGSNQDYRRGASYDLKNPANPRIVYDGITYPADDRKFVWSAPYPDGSFALASSKWIREAYTQTDSKLFYKGDGGVLTSTGLDGVQNAVMPSFSPDGRKVAFNFWAGTATNGVNPGAGHSLDAFDFTCGAAAGSTTCTSAPSFSNLRQLYQDNSRWPGWPTFVPDGKRIVFHNTITGGDVGGSGNDCRATKVQNNIYNCQFTTWYGATAEIWIVTDGTTPGPRRLDALNGVGYLPTAGNHPDDTIVNYMPTVNPVASGGYYWVVFTSRRLYGNLLTADRDDGAQKKLWVAAIDINAPAGADPSHPAFYLPGQELGAGNSRGFWVVDPCKANGSSCETGDECCNGFCRAAGDGGALVCQDKPPGTTCVQEFEKCTVNADCCDPNFQCIAGKCTRPEPIIK